MPTTAPTIPIGMTSQFSHPSSGTKATRPATSVTRPMRIEMTFMTAQMAPPRRRDKSGRYALLTPVCYGLAA